MVPQLACMRHYASIQTKGTMSKTIGEAPCGIPAFSAENHLHLTLVSCGCATRDQICVVPRPGWFGWNMLKHVESRFCWPKIPSWYMLIPCLSNGVHFFMIFHDLLFKPGPRFGIGWDLWPGATSLAGYIRIPVKSVQTLVWWAHLHVQLVLGDASQLVGHQSPTYYLRIFRYNLNKEEMGIISITKIYLGICWVLYLSYNMVFLFLASGIQQLSQSDLHLRTRWSAPMFAVPWPPIPPIRTPNGCHGARPGMRKNGVIKRGWLENPPVIDDFPSCQLPC